MKAETGRLRRWSRQQQFEPGPAGWLVNPFYFARRELIRSLGDILRQLHGEVLDVGCGRKPYRHLVPAERYVGVDIDTPVTRALAVADVYYDGKTLPFADARFDGVICSQVFEHVFTPRPFLAELRRVLRPGGTLVMTVPFVWDEHEQPFDYARYSSFGLKSALSEAGFTDITLRKTLPDSRVLFQLANAYLFKVTRSRSRLINLAAMLFLLAPVNGLGLLLGRLLPVNEDLYLDNIVRARRPAA